MLASMSPSKQFALGTRYAKGVQIDEGWPLYRRVISNGARMLALPLTSASDPMSGFFGIRKETVSCPLQHVPTDLFLTSLTSTVPQGTTIELGWVQDCARPTREMQHPERGHR